MFGVRTMGQADQTGAGEIDPSVLDSMNCAVDDPPPGAASLADVAARLCSGAVAISAATASWLQLVAEFDRREGWAVPGVTSCAQWLSWQCGVSPGTARDHVRLARALPGLPRLAAELGAGRLSYAKARAIARVADADTEPVLLELAENCTAAQLERVVAGWRRADAAATDVARERADAAHRHAYAEARAGGGSEEESTAAGRQAAAGVWAAWWPEGADPDRAPTGWEQRLDWHDEGDGSVTLRLRLSAEDAAQLIAAVEHRAEVLTRRERVARGQADSDDTGTGSGPDGRVRTPWTDWSAGHDLPTGPAAHGHAREIAAVRRSRVTVARTAALLDLVRAGAHAVERLPGDPARREVLIRVDAAVLAGDAAAGQAALDGVAALTPSQARRLACDAAITAVLVDGGEVLACGRSRRFATRAQRRALLARDGGCARPGCDETRPERLHAHHLLSWLHGGRTDVDNLVLPCDRCHGLVHDLDLVLDRRGGRLRAHAADGTAVWATSPTRHVDHEAHPSPPDALPPYWTANGARMDLRQVVGVVLGHRTLLRRRGAGGRPRDSEVSQTAPAAAAAA